MGPPSLCALVLAALLVGSGSAPPAEPCRAETPGTRRMIEDFLGDEVVADFRAEMGVPRFSPGSIRLLGRHGADAVPCTGLTELAWDKIQYAVLGERFYDVVFYAAGDFYFSVAAIRPHSNPSVITTGLSTVGVYARNLHYVDGIGW